MASKAQKRNEVVEEQDEDEAVVPAILAKISAAARAPLALVTAHRWKVLGLAVVAAIGLAVGSGLIDFGKLTSTVAQYAPVRSGETAATASASGTEEGAATESAAVIVAADPELKTCFTPTENCTGLIVAAIDGAKSEIMVQAYSFTAKPLIKALGRAHKRGVKVRVILDKADERSDRAGSRLIAQRILPQVDTGVASAHNKVMIIDRASVITGSFNFTDAAQKKNAENVLLIKGYPNVAQAYVKNWERRLAASRPYFGTMAPVL